MKRKKQTLEVQNSLQPEVQSTYAQGSFGKKRVKTKFNESSSTQSLQNVPDHTEKKKKRRKQKQKHEFKDPSTVFVTNPVSAPICGVAIDFMLKAGLKKEFKIRVGQTMKWRTVSKLSVRGNPPVIGLFAPESHRILPIFRSVAHHSSINTISELLQRILVEQNIKGYDGVHPGGLSYLGINVETRTKKVQLIFVFNSKDENENISDVRKMTEILNSNTPHLVHSVWLHLNPASRHDNAIYSRSPNSWHKIFGDEYVEEKLPHVVLKKGQPPPFLYFPPFVFRQANLSAFASIITEIRRWIPKGCKLLELYGGVGTIGLHLIDLVTSLVSSDENPHNEQCFLKSVVHLNASDSKKASYKTASASEMVRSGALLYADVLVVDPPRKGLDVEVLHAVKETESLKRVVYVSCGFKAFMQDCIQLQKESFHLIHAEGHLLFPGSNHIETMAVFDRQIN